MLLQSQLSVAVPVSSVATAPPSSTARPVQATAAAAEDVNTNTTSAAVAGTDTLVTSGGGGGGGGGDTRPSHAADVETHQAHLLDCAPAPGWTVHVNATGRLYYCNHVTRTAGWLPPAEAWKCGEDGLPYGWERALDDSARPYYINHVNKTTTYETPMVKCLEPMEAPEPRAVTLERSATLGFGFVAGSEKPVIVRFVTESGPSVDKLLPGDQILYVNGEDVKSAPREHVISLVRACTTAVTLLVCQPGERQQQGARKSTLLSASKRARLRSKPSRVRFAESVCVNGAPLFPPSAFSLGDLCVAPMANVLKVFLENGQTKSFKYDAWTSVQDVVTSLQTKLCLTATEHFSLVVEHIKSLKRNKLTLLDSTDTLARIASRPGAHKLRCLYRVSFVPTSAATLAQQDLSALDYLFVQCCNDVIQERFAPELQYDTALRLAALHVYQHALANNMPAAKLTVKTIEREFGLERFVPASLLEKMKRKEVRKLIAHFLKLHASMAGPGKQLTALQAKLHYLDIVSQLPSYGAKCFSAGPKADAMERVILVSPKFGISHITGTRNSVPIPIANLEDMKRIEVQTEDELNRQVAIRLQNDQVVSVSLEERDANELVLVLRGYFKLLTGQTLPVDKEETEPVEDLAPPYLSQHKVIPEKWSYINQQQVKNTCFALPPIYQNLNRKTNGLYNTMGRQSKPPLGLGLSLDSNMNSSITNKNHAALMMMHGANKMHSYDLQSVMSMEILESGAGMPVETRNNDVLRRVQEMQQLVESSEKYLTEQQRLERLNSGSISEWQESSVDVESDTESLLTEDALNKLRHSDSLLLLNKGGGGGGGGDVVNCGGGDDTESENGCCNGVGNTGGGKSGMVTSASAAFTNAAIEMLRYEMTLSESDNDSVSTPRGSPKHVSNGKQDANNRNFRVSFGLHSPDTAHADSHDLRAYLQRLRNGSSPTSASNAVISTSVASNTRPAKTTLNGDSSGLVGDEEDDMYFFDPELIDLTLLPPPATPDELDGGTTGGLTVPISGPPKSFADSVEKLNKLGILHENLDLEEFLASVTVQPPTQKITPAVELTPEEIMSYIIPPPPDINRRDMVTSTADDDGERFCDSLPPMVNGELCVPANGGGRIRRNSNGSCSSRGTSGNVIEYSTVDRKGAFSCCAKTRDKPTLAVDPTQYSDNNAKPLLPRRSSEHTPPPERPPKTSPPPHQDRPRSHSLTANLHRQNSGNAEFPPPKLPPRGDIYSYNTNTNTISQYQYHQVKTASVNGAPTMSLPTTGITGVSSPPAHLLLLPPKKPPLPPVPPLEVLRSRKNSAGHQSKSVGGVGGGVGITGGGGVVNDSGAVRTAGIGSPHLQRNRNMYNELESGFGRKEDSPTGSSVLGTTAVSTPTSPYLGRGAQLTAVPIQSPDKPPLLSQSHFTPTSHAQNQKHARSHSESTLPRNLRFREHVAGGNSNTSSPVHHQLHTVVTDGGTTTTTGGSNPGSVTGSPVRNGHCTSNREHLLVKTDVAMASLLVRLDQVAAQCNAAHEHGGGRMMSEEKFQLAKDEVTTQSLQLVHSSKMLVIAMSTPALPDLPENLAICLTILRRLTELCADLAAHTTTPLHTRNLVLKVHDVTAAFRHLVTGRHVVVERAQASRGAMEEHLAAEAERLANVLTTLLRSLRVFSP